MKTLIAGAVIALFATTANAGPGIDYTSHGYARVVSVEPIVSTSYRTVPRTSCSTVEQRGGSGAVPGAIIGGIVGNNMAKDRAAGTAVGVIAGAVIGEHMTEGQTTLREQCTTYHDKEYYNRINGYNVTFEFDGELRTVKLSRDPGSRVPVKIVKRVYVIE